MGILAVDDTYVQKVTKLGFTIQEINGVITPPLCPIPAGDFRMGGDKNHDPDAFSTESPVHRVHTSAYSIAKFPVTVGEFAGFVDAGGTKPETRKSVTWKDQLQHLDHPVVCVRWIDAVEYISWLQEQTGQAWRLPTEAEWEKAARWDANSGEGESRIYPWGNKFDNKRCNTNASRIGKTTPIDQYPQGVSPYGLWDTAGNVWEWTSSLFRPYPYDPNDGREDSASRKHRVLRGGAWLLDPIVARASSRNKENPVLFAGYFYDVGFRLVLDEVASSIE